MTMATLVAYGMPQKNIALRSASGAPLHKLATLVPGVTIGTLRGKRFDDFKVDPSTMKIQDFTIVPMQIFHFGGK
jgi:hypothetical protein